MMGQYKHDGWAIEIQDTNGRWVGFMVLSNHLTKQQAIADFIKTQNFDTWAKAKQSGYRCSKVYRLAEKEGK